MKTNQKKNNQKTNQKNHEWDVIRKPFQSIILNLQNNASIADRNYISTGDSLWRVQYNNVTQQLMDLKAEIKLKEKHFFG